MERSLHGPSPRSAEVMVEQQVGAWRAKNRTERTRSEATPRLVTVSREFGAGGARIAKRVADSLGFTLWDHELVEHVAERTGTATSMVDRVDEHRRDMLDDVLSTSFLRSSLVGAAPHGAISGLSYRTLLVRKVEELAQHGAAVVVGRGANFLVRAEQALRVRVISPFACRVERYGMREGLSFAQAERVVREKDRDRARFVQQLCGEDATDPLHYDLIVNTHDVSEEQAAMLIVDGYCARFGTPELAIAGGAHATP
jgi:cytidylate kinase